MSRPCSQACVPVSPEIPVEGLRPWVLDEGLLREGRSAAALRSRGLSSWRVVAGSADWVT